LKYKVYTITCMTADHTLGHNGQRSKKEKKLKNQKVPLLLVCCSVIASINIVEGTMRKMSTNKSIRFCGVSLNS